MKAMLNGVSKHGAALRLGLLWTSLLVIALSASSTGCIEECAAYGEYCTDLDCCDDMSCEFDQTAGYRCR